MKPKNFKVGEKAIVEKDLYGHGFKIGSKITITELDSDGFAWRAKFGRRTMAVLDDELTKIETTDNKIN